MESTTIKIDDVEYVRKDSVSKQEADKLDGMPYRIVRTYSAGVFAGYVEKREGKEAVLRQAKRIWQWQGAASLSELAQRGTSKPKECVIPIPVDRIELTEVIEVLSVTAEAKASIDSVPVWTR